MIQISLKRLFFFLKNYKNCPAARGSTPRSAFVMYFSSTSLLSATLIYETVFPPKYFDDWFKPLSSLSKILVGHLSTIKSTVHGLFRSFYLLMRRKPTVLQFINNSSITAAESTSIYRPKQQERHQDFAKGKGFN